MPMRPPREIALETVRHDDLFQVPMKKIRGASGSRIGAS